MLQVLRNNHSDTRWLIYVLLFSIGGACIVLVATIKGGIGVSPDSVEYLRVSRNPGDTLPRLTLWPPMYPLVLAGLSSLLGYDPFEIAHLLNGFLFLATIYLAGILLRNYLSQHILRFVALFSMVTAIAYYRVFTMLWSEPLFIVLTLLLLVILEQLKRRPSIRSLILLIITIQLATLTRYIGSSFIVLGGMAILLYYRSPIHRRIWLALLVMLIASIPLSGWLIKNYVVAGTFFGSRCSSQHTLLENLHAMIRTVAKWYLPTTVLPHWKIIVGLGIFAVLFLTVNCGLYKITLLLKALLKALKWQPHVLLTAVYLAALFASSSNYEQLIDYRYLSPIFYTITLVVWQIIEVVLRSCVIPHNNRYLTNGLFILMILWSLHPLSDIYSLVSSHIRNGRGYTSRQWQASATIDYLSAHLDGWSCEVYTNSPDVIYFWLNQEVKQSPRKICGANTLGLSSLQNSWPGATRTCLVWFRNIERPYLFPPEELLQLQEIQGEIELDDGTIYFLSPQ
jgi:hypothetical protein